MLQRQVDSTRWDKVEKQGKEMQQHCQRHNYCRLHFEGVQERAVE